MKSQTTDRKKRPDDNRVIEIMTGEYVTVRYTMASALVRLLSCVIDLAFIALLYAAAIFIYLELANWLARILTNNGLDILTIIVIIFLPTVNMLSEFFCNGKTLGKHLLKLSVVNDKCTPPSFSQCFVRWLVFPLDAPIIGLMMISGQGRRIGDHFAGTVVVKSASTGEEKVDTEKDFKFASPGYTPQYEELKYFTDNEVNAVRRVVYDKKYEVYEERVFTLVCERLNIDNDSEDVGNRRKFLEHVLQDCLYYKCS